MPTPSGLPKPGDQLYNVYFKQRFIVTKRSSNSYPMTVHLQPMPGKDFPREMRTGGRIYPNGTYGLLLEGPPDDLFRMGVSQWTFLPDQGSIEPGRHVLCNRDDAHGQHLYLRQRVWHYCAGIKTPERPRAIPPTADQSFATWYGKEFGEELPADDRDQVEAAAVLRSAFEAGIRYAREVQ